MSDGPVFGGGGEIRVETTGMLQAAERLEQVRAALGELVRATGWCIDDAGAGTRRVRLEEARALLAEAQVQSERAAEGLRVAAWRYGAVEHAALEAQRAAWACAAAAAGQQARVLTQLLGPAGAVLVGTVVAGAGSTVVGLRTAGRWVVEGELQPQLDPVLVDGVGLTVSSLDDVLRGVLLMERPQDLVSDDPSAFLGTEAVASALAALVVRPAGGPLSLTRGEDGRVARPADLAELSERLPNGDEPAGQIRIERYDGPDGRRWIVYIAGTVTFAPDGGEEPFDLASNVLGVADRTTDAQRAVQEAMRDAGVAPDEPVLLVGHSQGALTAVRVAEHGGYAVGGVVELGGPTEQIVLPEDVPRLAVEHDEDLVPVLGGAAAGGAAGLRRLVVGRSLPHGGAYPSAPPFGAGVTAHGTPLYTETLRRAQASGEPRVARFEASIRPFLQGAEGTGRRYRARRVSPPDDRTGDAG